MQLRVARHTNRLNELTAFYREIMGLESLGEFKDHSGYDGVFLGRKGLPWHLEFTQSGASANHTFDEDDLLVFYPESNAEHKDMLKRIEQNHIKIHTPQNPYWAENGILVKDPDGYGIIISDLKLKQ